MAGYRSWNLALLNLAQLVLQLSAGAGRRVQERVVVPLQRHRGHALGAGQVPIMRSVCYVELQTWVREDFTITEKAPTGAFSMLKVPKHGKYM